MGTFSHVHFNAMSGAGVAAQAILSNEKESAMGESTRYPFSRRIICTMRCATGEAEIWRGISLPCFGC